MALADRLDRLSSTGGYYIGVLVLASVLAPSLNLRVSLPIGADVAYVVLAVGTLAALALFVPYVPVQGWSRPALLGLAALLALWLLTVARMLWAGSQFALEWLVVPLLLVLLIIKRPTASQSRFAIDVLAWSVVLASWIFLVMEVAGVWPSWYVDPGLAESDRLNYWLPLADLLGLDGRWSGPWFHPTWAAPIGGFLVVYGLTRRRWQRVVLAGTGVLILLLAAGRSAQLATAVGVTVVLYVQYRSRLPRWGSWLLMTVGLGLLAVMTARMVGSDSGLTGRAAMWPEYVRLWRSSPLVGVGPDGIAAAISRGDLPDWAIHAHDIWLDNAARLGLLGLSLVIVLGIALIVLAVRAARAGEAAPAGVVALFVAGTLSDTLLVWSLATPLLLVVVTTLALADGTRDQGTSTRDVSRAPSP